jgi:hypothetical protein
MTWFVESPWPSLAIGAAIEVALVIALLRTARAAFLAPILLVAALTIGMLLVERAVVTQSEEVQDALDGVAKALEANDVQAVLAAFSPNSPRLAEVRSALARFEVSDAGIGGDLQIRFNPLTIPPSATAYFTGRVQGKDKRGVVPYENLFRKFKVTLHHEGDRWLIADYSDLDVGDRPRR